MVTNATNLVFVGLSLALIQTEKYFNVMSLQLRTSCCLFVT